MPMSVLYCVGLLLQLLVAGQEALRVEVVANPTVVKEGGSFSLSCSSTIDDRSVALSKTITWTKDNRRLTIDGKRITAFTPEFLHVNNARDVDAGWYECTVQMSSDSGSSKAYVTVEGETIVQSVRDRVIAVVRSNVSLECRAANSLAVRWLYKLMKVEVSSRIRIKASAGRSILEIDNVQMSDAGTYQCKIGVKLARIHLSVDLPSTPQIVTHPENVTAVAGERVELVCDAIGKPPLIMSWLKRTSRGDVEISRNRILAYEAVTKRQAGIYICVAKNTNGHSESKTATIHVQEREHSSTLVAKQKDVVALTCPFSDSTVTWTKSGQPVELSGTKILKPRVVRGSALLITDATCSDDGEYSCAAEQEDDIFRTTLIVEVYRSS
ncbi:neural cell adhesion molecule 1-like [Oscarella lobularis]|uniref:neural cell adhesion molecule 1-like n=1 Tax=Oscarella lobularis TaxID=121494 RepID=UPI00331367E0